MGKLLTLGEIEKRRETAVLIAAAESTIESAKIADRERSGCLITQRGRIVRKKKRDGVYVSAVKSMMHSTSVKTGSQVPGKSAEIAAWDAMVKADRAIVACGGRSALVKVIKGVPKSTAIQLAMEAALCQHKSVEE